MKGKCLPFCADFGESKIRQFKLQTRNTKHQTSSKSQAPNSKHHTPNTREAPSFKLEARAAVWSLELGIYLMFGAWFLVFRFWDFSGAWCLEFGVSFSHLSPSAHPQPFQAPLSVGPPAPRQISGRIHPSSSLPPPGSGASRPRRSCLPPARRLRTEVRSGCLAR